MPQSTYLGHIYDYTICRSPRKTLGIYAHLDHRIQVRAHYAAPLEEIGERVRKRRRWIVRQWQEFILYSL
ncbi:MAG: hypothetical protein KDD01_16465 [Phaeodactylibacter sp.]|nr:hypothetical protein [Phaeodactylibacter sp.]